MSRVVFLLVLAGCIPGVYSQQLQLQLLASDVSTLGYGNVPSPMLAGTTTCAQLGWAPDLTGPPAPSPLDCFTPQLYGPVVVEQDCLTFTDPGVATLSFAPADAACGVADSFTFPVLDPSEVYASPLDFDAVGQGLLLASPRGYPPSQPPDETWKIVEDGYFRFYPWLFARADGSSVGFELARIGLGVDAPSGGLTWTFDTNNVLVELEPGATGQLSVEHDHPVYGATFPFADLLGVEVKDAVDLEIRPLYTDLGLSREPFGARAVIYDAEGDLLWGAPVIWTLDEGRLAVGAQGYPRLGPDYVMLRDRCEEPEPYPVERQVTLRATIGSLTDTVVLTWTAPAGVAYGWTPDPECLEPTEPPPLDDPDPDTGDTLPIDPPDPEPFPSPSPWEEARWAGGCLCSTSGSPPPAPSLLALALWLSVRYGGARGGAAAGRRRRETGSLR